MTLNFKYKLLIADDQHMSWILDALTRLHDEQLNRGPLVFDWNSPEQVEEAKRRHELFIRNLEAFDRSLRAQWHEQKMRQIGASPPKIMCPKCHRFTPWNGYDHEKRVCKTCLLPEAPPEVYDALNKLIVNDPRRHVRHDGGRAEAGFKGKAAGDCGARAVAIATGKPYKQVYDDINRLALKERTGKRKKKKSHANTGVFPQTMRKLMAEYGWTWVPTMSIGSGCKVHLKAEELPKGRLVVAVSRHYVAVIDGIIHDNHDPARNGTRCVYGYFHKE